MGTCDETLSLIKSMLMEEDDSPPPSTSGDNPSVYRPFDRGDLLDAEDMLFYALLSDAAEWVPSRFQIPPEENLECNTNKRKRQRSVKEVGAMVSCLSRVVSGCIIETDAPFGLGPSAHGDEELQPGNCRRTSQGSQSNYPSKRMKPFNGSSPSKSMAMVMSRSISHFPGKGLSIKDTVPDSAISQPEATRCLSSTGGQGILEARESHVKLGIKSFTVPEFFVEIPETATVSFLKKTIMEKATAVVGGGQHVDLLVQGEKIIDENKILSETGISHESRLDVILEPKPLQDLVCPCPVSCPLQLHCDVPPPLTRYSPADAVVHQGPYGASTDPLFCNLDDEILDDHELAESQTNIIVGKNTMSREVIVRPETTNSSKNARRREFFSVSEVEALVQAVEKLGTGRWQKIKEEAFGNASNRTYADLKDKWRSLVKTAKIPANKRRGAVIPRWLLDRVLAIETLNSQQQAMK